MRSASVQSVVVVLQEVRELSLLEQARAEQISGKSASRCKLARGIIGTFDEDKMPEVIELLRAEDVQGKTKWVILSENGVEISQRRVVELLRDGCSCQWCRENWM